MMLNDEATPNSHVAKDDQQPAMKLQTKQVARNNSAGESSILLFTHANVAHNPTCPYLPLKVNFEQGHHREFRWLMPHDQLLRRYKASNAMLADMF